MAFDNGNDCFGPPPSLPFNGVSIAGYRGGQWDVSVGNYLKPKITASPTAVHFVSTQDGSHGVPRVRGMPIIIQVVLQATGSGQDYIVAGTSYDFETTNGRVQPAGFGGGTGLTVLALQGQVNGLGSPVTVNLHFMFNS